MGRRGNPYDNALMECFINTPKVEAIYPMGFESVEGIGEHLPRFIDGYNDSVLGYVNPQRFEEEQSHKPVKATE